MERLRLWRYKKLANENVKDEKVIDDEDYNSCFQLKTNLKNTCKRIIMMKNIRCDEKMEKVTVDDETNVAREEKKIIKKLREQQNHKQKQKNQKSFYKCFNNLLNKTSSSSSPQQNHHERLHEVSDEEIAQNEYLASGIYEIFGHSCASALTSLNENSCDVEAEDLSGNSWYQSGLLGKFSLEMLKHQSPGSFIIHKGSCKSGNFILSLRVPSEKSSKVVHYLILQSKKGYRIKGATKFFPTIASLVTHHSVMCEQLPVALLVQRSYSNSLNDDDFSSLEDLKIIFTDLE